MTRFTTSLCPTSMRNLRGTRSRLAVGSCIATANASQARKPIAVPSSALEEKIFDVVGLYMAPPTNAVVLSIDEKTQIQALGRTQPILPLRRGIPARHTHDDERNGTTDLYAALEVASGVVTGERSAHHTGADFLRFLRTVARRYRRRELHIVLDNSSTHNVPAVRTFLEEHPRIHVHFTPTGASWMNMVEAWFGTLTRRSVRRGSFDTLPALLRHIRAYIAHWNEHPTPFVWTTEPADIIRKAVRRSVNKTSKTAQLGGPFSRAQARPRKTRLRGCDRCRARHGPDDLARPVRWPLSSRSHANNIATA
jgi:transposase